MRSGFPSFLISDNYRDALISICDENFGAPLLLSVDGVLGSESETRHGGMADLK
jgi:hypothetical protein